MMLKKPLFFIAFLFQFVAFSGCVKKENTNLFVESGGRDPHVDNFFNAIGLPLNNVNGNNFEEVSNELKRVSPLFTNAIPPKISNLPESSPFFALAKNVGAYFATQVWKTQITSIHDVRFFDLNQNVNDSISGIQFQSAQFDLPFVFLNPYGDKTDPKNYLGSVVKGFYGKMNFQTGQFSPLSHLYIMEYKLRDSEGSKVGPNVRTYYALVSIPVDTTKQHSLIMYAHGGDFGVSSSELVTVLHEKLKNFAVVAPLFPGEPLCTQVNAQGKGCLRFDANNNLVPDNIGKFQNPEVHVRMNSIVPIAYSRSPLLEDINAYLGAHNAVSRVMNVSLHPTNPFLSDKFPNGSILFSLPHTDTLLNPFQFFAEEPVNQNGDGPLMIPTGTAPQTIAVGSSRGGAVLLAAIGRMGFLMNGASSYTQFKHVVYDSEAGPGESKEVKFQYSLFSSAATFFTPSSFVTGKLRLFTIMIMQNNLDSIASLPMTLDLAKNPFLVKYRESKDYFSEIQTPITNDQGNILSPASDSLSQLITFIASNDITFLAPFLSSGLQNWNSYYHVPDEELFERAPGSLILLHSSQDLIVPLTESTIAAQAMNTVWAGIYHTPMDPYGNYLSDSQFRSMHSMLMPNLVPGVGVGQYTFQPTDHFFNIPCDKNMLASIQQPDVIYNTNVGRCYGGGFSPNADGTNLVGNFYAHMDAGFYTARLMNLIPEQNLSLGILSANPANNKNFYTVENDGAIHMKYGAPKFKNEDVCLNENNCFSYRVAMRSPTYMRYMGMEGVPSVDVIASKSQIFEGHFKPNNTSNIKPHDVLFNWLDYVTCNYCDTITGASGDEESRPDFPLFQSRFGVFHDFTNLSN